MLELCSYETDALGYSSFCNLFTQEDFLNYEYYFDLVSTRVLLTTYYGTCLLYTSDAADE